MTVKYYSSYFRNFKSSLFRLDKFSDVIIYHFASHLLTELELY